ncbi:hypothetical protein ACWGHA_24950 [Streptomyces xanthophaeus]
MSTEALPPRWAEVFGEPAAMRLASVDDGTGGHGPTGGTNGGGSSNEDLAITGGPWSKAASAAGELGISMAGALGKMAGAHEGIAAGTTGFQSTAALATVRTSWEKRLSAVRDECSALRPQLLGVANEIGEVNARNEVAFSQLIKKQEPTK